jgi:hypothetical protein
MGGGASLTADDLRAIALVRKRFRTVALTDTVFLAWWANELHANDAKWWQSRESLLGGYAGARVGVQPFASRRISFLRDSGCTGYDPRLGYVRHGNSSGYSALHNAIQKGAAKIILAGFDMGGEHWHSGYKNEPPADYANMAKAFATLLPAIVERSIDVVNCSPTTRLDCFRCSTLLPELAK